MTFSRRNLLVTLGGVTVTVALARVTSAPAAAPNFDVPDVDGRFERVIDAKNGRQSIYKLNVNLNDDEVPKDKDLFVYAYSVFIAGTLRTNGRSLTIVAKHIQVSDGAKIDLTGLPATPDYEGRVARNGQNAGEKGDDGRNGAVGPNSGQLTLVCDALGGTITVDARGRRGGGGESGGNGAVGPTGPQNPKKGSRGGQGGRGGDAGRAGMPGRGGNGGNVTVRSINEVKGAQVVAELRQGPSGAPGQNGSQGAGGSGGWGVSGKICEENPCP